MAIWGLPALREVGFGRDPFALLKDLQREMNTVFDDYSGTEAGGFPPLNVWVSPDAAKVTAELPGVSSEDIELTVSGRAVTLRGKRIAEEPEKGAKFHRRERGSGEFARTIELPFPLDAERVDATFSKGILTLTLPRAESDKPRKIAINARS